MTLFIKRGRLFFILLIILFVSGNVFAQNTKQHHSEIDSLLLLLRDKNNDTIYINHLNEIAWIYRKINADSSIFYANQALSCNNNIHPRGLVKSYNTLGVNDYMKSDFYSSVDWFEKALEVCSQTNYKEGIAKTANNIGTIYQMLGKHTKSLVFNQQSLKMKEELGDTIGLVNSLINISSLYYQLNKFSDAVAYSRRALSLAEINVPKKIPLILNSLGVHHKELGDYSKALCCLNRAIEINTQNNDEKRIAINKQNIADIYSAQGDYDEAMLSYLDALLIKEKINDKRGIAKTKMGIGVLAFKTKDYNKCVDYLIKSKAFYTKSGQIFELKAIDDFLSKAYFELKQIPKAYNTLLSCYQLGDSLYKIESKKIIEELEIKYKTEQKELQIQKQEIEIRKKKQANQFYIIALLILLAGISVISWISRKKQQAFKKLAEKNIEAATHCDKQKVTKESSKFTEKQQDIYNKLSHTIESDQIYTDVNLTIDSMAKSIQTNRTELSQILKVISNKTYPVFINEQRIKHAVRLLSCSKKKYSIEGIANESGFKSTSNFYKLFKENTGMTPSEFQKSLML